MDGGQQTGIPNVTVHGEQEPPYQPSAILFSLSAVRAKGLPSTKTFLGKERQYLLSASDGTTTWETAAARSRKDWVEWAETLSAFTISPSSHLAVVIFEKHILRERSAVGRLEIPFHSLSLAGPREFDISLTQRSTGSPTQRAILSLSINIPKGTQLTSAPALSDPPTPVSDYGDAGNSLVVQNADKALGSMEDSPSLASTAMTSTTTIQDTFDDVGDIESTWDGVLGQIKWVMDAVDAVAQVHPWAKMAWSVLSCIPKAFLTQVGRDINVRALLTTMRNAFDFIEEANALKNLKPETKQTRILRDMFCYACDCGDFIQSYARDTRFWKRTLINIGRGVEEQIRRYRTTLTSLHEEFLRHAVLGTQIAVSQLQGSIGALRDRVDQIPGRLDGISSQLERVESSITDADMEAKIREIPYPKRSRFRPDKGCLTGTRIAFLDRITNWVNNPESNRALVLFGQAGTGKSAIANELAHRFSDMRRLTSSFVFSRTEQSQNDTPLLFTGLVHDLADRHPTFRASLGSVIQRDTSLRLGAQDYATVFESLLLEPLKALPLVGPIFIVIDALDESEDAHGLAAFLADNIGQLPPNFRVLITSRPDEEIEHIFTGARSFDVLRTNDPELAARVNDDIRAYLQANLPPRVFKNHGKALETMAEQLFQWVAAACEYIQRPPRGLKQDDCIRRILNPPSDQRHAGPLDKLYRTILDSCFDLSDDDVRRRYKSVMGQIFAAIEPFSVHSLTQLRCSTLRGDSDGDGDSVHAIVSGLGSLLSNVNPHDSRHPITPLHTSFRDFLTNVKRSSDFWVDVGDSHRELAHLTLDMMHRYLRFNICRLKSSYRRNSDIPDLDSRVAEYISSALSYACRLWDDHLEHVTLSAEFVSKVQSLFETKFLFWLEALSLLNNVDLASQALTILRAWLAEKQIDRSPVELGTLPDLVDDAFAFMRYFGMPIAQSAPHIYLSALPFSPTTSLIYQNYSRLFPNTLSLEVGRLSHWPAQEMAIQLDGGCASITFSPDGTRIASGMDDGTICVWNTITGQPATGLFTGHTGRVLCVAFSQDGQHIASGSEDGTFCIWNAMTRHVVSNHSSIGRVKCIAVSPDGRHVASGSGIGVYLWDAMTGELVTKPFTSHSYPVTSVAFSPDGRRIASGSEDTEVRLWDSENGEELMGPLDRHTDSICSVAFSPDGRYFASGSEDCTVCVWDAVTGELVAEPFKGHINVISSVAFSPDSLYVASSSLDFTIRLWSTTTGQMVAGPFTGHTRRVTCVTFSPGGTHIASASGDRTIRIWNVKAGQALPEPTMGHAGPVRSVVFSPDGERIATASSDQTIRVWDAVTGQMALEPFKGHSGLVRSVAFSPDGTRIASGSSDSTVRVWDASTGHPVAQPYDGHAGMVYCVAFSPDGRRIVSASGDGTARIWDITTGEEDVQPLSGHHGLVLSVAFSPNGRRIASGSDDETMRIWDASTGEATAGPCRGHSHWVHSVAFSPDSQRIASGSDDATIRIWDAETGDMAVGPLRGHSAGAVHSVVFSPDGRLVASSSWDCTIRIWSAKTGLELARPLLGHAGPVLSIAFSPDGRHIASSSRDTSVRLWIVPAAEDTPDDLPSIRPSANQDAISESPDHGLIVDADGWVRGEGGELLMWIPEPHRVGLPRPDNVWVRAKRDTALDRSRFLHGLNWMACIEGGPSATE